jgi:cysteine desulfurase
MNPIYLDNAATTKIDPQVLAKMLPYLTNSYGNPASTHLLGQEANTAVEIARSQVALTLGCDPKEIIWTSGATEATNLALIGAATFYKPRGRHLITLTTEHKATLDTLAYLEKDGFTVTYLTPKSNGLLDLTNLITAIRHDTILVSVAFVNSEIGVIQDIATIGDICREHNIFFHVDAAQAIGKIAFNLTNLPISLMSLSAHKVYGPKGVGALYIKRHPRVRLNPLIHGGGHERGLRAGTLATHQIVGMGEAFHLALEHFTPDLEKIKTLQSRLITGLKTIPGIFINGDLINRVPHNLNFGFNGVNANALIAELAKVIAVSTSSACTSSLLEPSYVLKALGLSDELANSSLRISLGKFNTLAEIDFVVKSLYKTVIKLR